VLRGLSCLGFVVTRCRLVVSSRCWNTGKLVKSGWWTKSTVTFPATFCRHIRHSNTFQTQTSATRHDRYATGFSSVTGTRLCRTSYCTRRSTEPHHARRPASRQSTHGATQCSRGRPTSWWVDRYSAESGQWQSKPSTLRSSDSAYNSRKARCKKFTGNEWSWDGAHDDHTTHECSRTWQSSRFTDTRHHQCVLTADHTPTPTAEMLVMETQTPLNLMSNLITSSVNRKQRREIRFLLYFSQVTMLSVSKCRSLLKNESVLEMGR